MRVVSLLPSATETLCATGGEALLVGRSHECDFPPSVTRLPILTAQRTNAMSSAAIDAEVRASLAEHRSLYTLDADLLASLKPDVILTQDLCEVCSIDLNTVRRIAGDLQPQPTIISLDPHTLEDVFDAVLRVGEAVGLITQARDAAVALRERYWHARDFVNPYDDGPEVAFLEWMDPLFTGGHWTPGLIRDGGARHSLNEPGAKSRQITSDELIGSKPDRLIICPCGYTIEQTMRELSTLTSQRWWRELSAVQAGHVVVIDGHQMFNRPGPRLVDAFEWLVGWINDRPELTPRGFRVMGLDSTTLGTRE